MNRRENVDERWKPPQKATGATPESGPRGSRESNRPPSSRAQSSRARQGTPDPTTSRRRSEEEPASGAAEAAKAESEKPSESPKVLAHERGRGRSAETPTQVPKQGWLDVLSRTKQQLGEDNLSIVAAGVAFYAFVAVVPALIALVAIYGLVADPAQVTDQITSLAQILPGEALPLLREQMVRITSNDEAAGLGAIIGVLIAIYSSANATKALISGLNIAYDENEKRGFFKLSALAIVLTFGGIIGAVMAVSLVAVLPKVLEHLNVSGGIETLLNLLRWPLLIGGFMGALAVAFRYGPSRRDPQWKWVTPGAIVAAVLWLIGSALFSLYVSRFGSYDKTYGPLGAVVVFLMWLYISAFVVLIGAEINSELERQTAKDTTDEPSKPLGARGAQSADTIGPARHKMPEKEKQ